jgi:hypothetical protein
VYLDSIRESIMPRPSKKEQEHHNAVHNNGQPSRGGTGHAMNEQVSEDTQRLLELHSRLHLGLNERVAKRLRVSPSYVSLVARGKRTNERIMAELVKELQRLS